VKIYSQFKVQKMKKVHLSLIAMFMLALIAELVFISFKAVSQKKTTQTANVIPGNVAKILSNSCTACHNDGGKVLAMSMWNFSSWDKYSAKKQSRKASSMCNAITKGKMPPASIKKVTPDKIPTAAQIEIVCKWANSLKVK
jgi:hypothetical protein